MDTAADRAASGVRALIASGEYGPGERLPAERELAARLKLSRPALREGLRRLRSGGVLEARRGSGTYVVEVDLDGVFEVRLKLEPLAAEYSAMRRSDDEAAEMRRLIQLMGDEIDDYEVFAAADTRIHSLVAQSAQRPVLLMTLDRISEIASLTRSVTAPIHEKRVESIEDIDRVVAAIERKHPKRAASAMERHMLHVWDDFVETVAETRDESASSSVLSSA